MFANSEAVFNFLSCHKQAVLLIKTLISRLDKTSTLLAKNVLQS